MPDLHAFRTPDQRTFHALLFPVCLKRAALLSARLPVRSIPQNRSRVLLTPRPLEPGSRATWRK